VFTLNWRQVIGLIFVVVGVLCISSGVVLGKYSVFGGDNLVVSVVDGDSGVGLSGAEIRLFYGVSVVYVDYLESHGVDFDYLDSGIPVLYFVLCGVTNENGVASISLVDIPSFYSGYQLYVSVDGYTSDFSHMGLSYIGPSTSFDVSGYSVVVELRVGEPEPAPEPYGDLSLFVVDENGVGLANATVYLFDSDVYQGAPGQEMYLGITDPDGFVMFSGVSGGFDMAIVAEGYTSEHPLVLGDVVYSYYGFVWVGNDVVFNIPLVSDSGSVVSLLLIISGVIFLVAGIIILLYDQLSD
jgi:hypothetical protein